MAAYGQPPNLGRVMAAVQPRNGLPVRNMGGIPQTPMTTPPKPFVPGPTVASGPPGPAPGARVIPPAPRIPTAPLKGMAAPTGEPVPGPGFALPGAPPAPASVPPAAPPSPVPPPAPPAVASPTSTSTSSTTSSSGQTPVVSPQAGGWNLEGQLQNFLGGAFNGSVTPEFINRAKGDVFRTVQGQTKQATNQINDDAVRRGLYRSGIPAEGIANVQGQAQGAMARGVADILNNAENQNIQGRQNAAGVASNVLGMNRSWEQYNNERSDAAAARAAAGRPRMFTYIDPETGQATEMDESWF